MSAFQLSSTIVCLVNVSMIVDLSWVLGMYD